jgi:hypothetical protein
MSNKIKMLPDTLIIEHRSGHRTEDFSKDGEPWIRDTLDGHVLVSGLREFLKIPVAASIHHREVDHSAAPVQERTSGLAAGAI